MLAHTSAGLFPCISVTVSFFLLPFAPPALPGLLAHMAALTPASTLASAGIPTSVHPTSYRSVANHLMMPPISYPSLRESFGLHPSLAGSPHHPTESRSYFYGPVVRFQLLPTYPHGYAVTFSYEGGYPLGTDFHRPVWCASWAHERRRLVGLLRSVAMYRETRDRPTRRRRSRAKANYFVYRVLVRSKRKGLPKPGTGPDPPTLPSLRA